MNSVQGPPGLNTLKGPDMNTTTDDVSIGASSRLAAHAAGLTFEKFPAATVHAYKRTMLDFLTCAVSGAAMPVSQALLAYFQESDATRTTSVIGSNAKLSAPNAALVTGANVHGLDFDDGHTQGSAHPSGAIFPAVMAVAQQQGSSARENVTAVGCGYDVMCRIAAALHPEAARRGHYHAVIDGIKELQREHHFKADDVAHADLGMYAVGFNGHDYKHCDSLLDAQMSAPVAGALAIVLGDVTATMFVPATLDRPDVRALIERIDARIDDECERIYPGVRSGSARIELRNGTALEKRLLEPKGEVKNPMTDADLQANFRANCEPLLGSTRCDRVLADVWKFEQLGEVTQFFTWG